MKKQLLVGSLVLASTSAMAGIGEPSLSNNYVEGAYLNQGKDGVSLTGLGVKGSYKVMPNVAIIGGITTLKKDPVENQTLSVGAAFLMGLDLGGNQVDVNLHGELAQLTTKVPQVCSGSLCFGGGSASTSGMIIGAEGRMQFNDMVEGFGDFSLGSFSGNSSNAITFGARIGDPKKLQGVVSYGLGDSNRLTLGGRFNF